MAAQPQPLRPDAEEQPRTPVAPRPAGGNFGAWLQRLIILLLIIVGGSFAALEVRERMIFVDETDARMVGELITISSRVSGWLGKVSVRAGDTIKVGQVLARVDARESRLLVRELNSRAEGADAERRRMLAERDLIDLQTRSRLETQQSTASAAQATVAALDAQLELANSELVRSESLFTKRVIAKQQLDQARANAARIAGEHRAAVAEYQEAIARLQEARADQSRLKVIDEELEMLTHRRDGLMAKLAQQQLDLEDRIIRSTIDGVVDKTFVEPGEFVRQGQRLMVVHDPGTIWVEVNIKETQIARLRPGDLVQVTVDAYPDAKLGGRVESIGTSTTATYALLPNPNPSGNFTKVTQRLPVRITLDKADRRLHPGMMVEVRIDVGER
ncbi:MAG: membrane fusion protein (multidrug efflux system) [Gammaproteobacteria bacterium]|jgi:membrane fusion protein (multidrug efflux system)